VVAVSLAKLWQEATTENLAELGDLDGYRSDFHNLFGFGFVGVDYKAETNEMVGVESIK
jgi:enoyl-[acyl-carrier protein] reductase/trans-2-enoyl-CoA reductase (NAD+)